MVESVEHYTPQDIIESARKVLGRIDLDPFSSATANLRVRATAYGNAEEYDGFTEEWDIDGTPVRVFCNPPGGKYRFNDSWGLWSPLPPDGGPGVSGAALAWHVLQHERRASRVEAAIFICFSLNVFQTSQAKELVKCFGSAPAPCMFPFCVPARRLQYETADGKKGKSPPHPSAIVFVPPLDAAKAHADAFETEFAQYGQIRL